MAHGAKGVQVRRILVTGSSGFIGSQLVCRLRSRGDIVLGIGRRKLEDPEYLSHDLSTPIPDLGDGGFDVVIHAAARSNPWGSVQQFYRDNVTATQNVLDYCRRIGSPRLIFISSSSVYYRPQHQFNIVEETPQAETPVNHYAWTKQLAEQLVQTYAGPWTILRPRAVYGPGDTVLLPRILTAARAGRLPVLTVPNGPVIGDLIYIDNLLDAVESAANNEEITGAFNLTNGEPVAILDFLFEVFDGLGIRRPTRRVSAGTAMAFAGCLELFHRIFRPSVEPSITRFGVHVFRYSKTFDISRARSLLGSPRIDNAESLKRTVAWFREQLGQGIKE
ncbi:MAG: NAD(P)-dependent oxidoreductase [Planctomycetaceae bacterium]|nr:NAD(P)-dependent oxidoreductase [Planctomycetaceae bacterium]